MRNRLWNCKNPYQGEFKKVLCVCGAGLLRSPTAALVLSSDPFNFNTRAAGASDDHALIRVDDVLVEWADEIVCMNSQHAKHPEIVDCGKPVFVLDIPDIYSYRHEELAELIRKKYLEKTT